MRPLKVLLLLIMFNLATADTVFETKAFHKLSFVPNMFFEFKIWVSTFATIATILQFCAGILVCNCYVTKHSTGEASALTFICTMLSCSFWLGYGLLKPDDNITFVNVIGIILMSSYVIVFFKYTMKKMLVLKQLCAVILILIVTIAYVNWQSDYDILINQLGLMSCFLTLVAIGAPMSKLMHVIKVKNTECLPYQIIIMSFVGSSLWCIYGIIKNDTYLQVPNFIGAALALSQLSLFLFYPRKAQLAPMLPLKTTSIM